MYLTYFCPMHFWQVRRRYLDRKQEWCHPVHLERIKDQVSLLLVSPLNLSIFSPRYFKFRLIFLYHISDVMFRSFFRRCSGDSAQNAPKGWPTTRRTSFMRWPDVHLKCKSCPGVCVCVCNMCGRHVWSTGRAARGDVGAGAGGGDLHDDDHSHESPVPHPCAHVRVAVHALE